VQLALAFSLLIGAGLMVRSVARLLAVDAGFRPDHVLTLRVLLPDTKYRRPDDVVGFFEKLTEEISRVPGVVAVGSRAACRSGACPSARPSRLTGARLRARRNLPVADIRIVGGRYFEALRIELLRDVCSTRGTARRGAARAIVNERLVRELFRRTSRSGDASR